MRSIWPGRLQQAVALCQTNMYIMKYGPQNQYPCLLQWEESRPFERITGGSDSSSRILHYVRDMVEPWSTPSVQCDNLKSQ